MGEVTNLGVEEDGQRVIPYQSEGSEAVSDNAPIGEYTHMHWTALGKAILAERFGDSVDEYVDRRGLLDETENTITDPDRLHQELAAGHERGFTVENEERREGIRSIAVPITVEESVVGAVSLSDPRERFDDQRIRGILVSKLQDASNVIEVKYAY